MADAPLLETRSIDKSFGPIEALKDVSVCFRAGAVHALVGENGAASPPFMKILAGVHAPGRGTHSPGRVETGLAGPPTPAGRAFPSSTRSSVWPAI